jgi:hypothetical protein
MAILDYVLIIVWIILLIVALSLFIKFFICDKQTCVPFMKFKQFDNEKDGMLYLLNGITHNSTWPIAYIGSSICTVLVLWIANSAFDIRKSFITFITIFLVIYFLLSFYLHHYIRPVGSFVADYISKQDVS